METENVKPVKQFCDQIASVIPLLSLYLFSHRLPLPLSLCPVCKAAKADLVFLVDGSWSIGDDNFLKIIRFLYSTSGALDRIGPDGTQVPQRGGRMLSQMLLMLVLLSVITAQHSWDCELHVVPESVDILYSKHLVSGSSPVTLFDWQVIDRQAQCRNTARKATSNNAAEQPEMETWKSFSSLAKAALCQLNGVFLRHSSFVMLAPVLYFGDLPCTAVAHPQKPVQNLSFVWFSFYSI